MANQQLRDYISEQLHVGVPKDAIRSALLESGWKETDVTEAMNLETGGAVPQTQPPAMAQPKPAVSQPASSVQPAMAVAKPAQSFPSAQPAAALPQSQPVTSAQPTITVSKPAQSSAPSFAGASSFGGPSSFANTAAGKPESKPATADVIQPKMASSQRVVVSAGTINGSSQPVSLGTSAIGAKPEGHSKLPVIILSILVFVFAGTTVAFYMRTNSLQKDFDATFAQSGAGQKQATALVKERDALASRLDAAATENKELVSSLYLFVYDAKSTEKKNIELSGTLSKGKSFYELKTTLGVTAYVANSSEPAIESALKPLAGTTVRISGTREIKFALGQMTVLAVNGVPIGSAAVPPPGAPTSSAPTSTVPSSATTTKP